MASLKPALLGDVKKMPGFRILEGRFTAIQQSVGTRKNSPRSLAFLESFVRDSVASGFVAELIERHQVQGLTVAPL